MIFEIMTLFPGMFDRVFEESIIKRACERGIISIHLENIRDYSDDPHRRVDDYPYGGDPGMLIKPEPLAKSIGAVKEKASHLLPKVIFLSPHGERLKHAVVEELAREQCLILLCGRYKGIDNRIRDRYVDREISIGDYILSGGEIAAMILIDAVSRLIPGVLGNDESAERDSFFNGLLSPPQYTRPEVFEGLRVPEVLISGHHKKIKEWQQQQAEEITRRQRPDLWKEYQKLMQRKNKI